VKHKNSARWAVLAAAALGITSMTAGPSGAADPSPATPGPSAQSKLNPNARPTLSAAERSRESDAAGRQAYFVRFTGEGAADVASRAGSGARGVSAAKARRAEVSRVASGVLAAARKVDSKATSIYTVSNAIPGAGLMLDAAGLKAVSAAPNVAKVSRLVPKTAELTSVDSLVKAVNVWKFSGNTGKGVTIGIIDTGVDYTHANFGGPGTVAAYDAAFADDTSPSWLQRLPKKGKAKFAGGYDFAGDEYDAGGDFGSPVPAPDNNPLDCNGHGSHVAGISAGYGVRANHRPVKAKQYSKLSKKKLDKLLVGPGMAPQAKLFALRVFGCEGSTNLDIPAMDRALDPNGDGNFKDHLDIINASLGSDYGPQDDPSLDVVNRLAAHGVLPAMSIGNNGDLTDTGGTPGSATASIASASSVDKLELLDQIRVNAPASVAGKKIGQMSVAYDWIHKPDVTGTVIDLTQAGNEDGCAPFSPADAARVAGKIAWLEWDDNDATRECGSAGRSQNAQNAGAIGAIFTSSLEVFPGGITGDADIPVFQLTKSGTDQLRPFAENGTLNVTFDGDLAASFERVTKSATDTISSFTSRGPRGSFAGAVVKPDVAAPGDTIGSTGMGTGYQPRSLSGTSMASPATAGIAALVKAAHPGWSPLKVKADVMNTARHDLFTGAGKSGHRYGPARVGAGRVDAKAAVKNRLLAWTKGPNNPVSASFGTIEAPINGGTITRTKKVKVQNLDNKTVDVSVNYEALVSQPGVTYSVKPSKLTIKQKKTKTVTVTMTVVPGALRHTIDPTMDVNQLDTPRQYVSDSSGRLLVKQKGKKANRVPVYGGAEPTSQTTATLSGNNIVVSGQGVNTGSSSTDYRSWLSVLEFGEASPVLPACDAPTDEPDGCATQESDKASDWQYVGAGSNSSMLWFGVSTHGDWANLGTITSPDVYFDTDGDGIEDYETYVSTVEATDLVYAFTLDLNDPACLTAAGCPTVDAQPVNFNDGNVDTNVFGNSVVLLPVAKSAVGLTGPGSHPIEYFASVYNAWYGIYTDGFSDVMYDAGTPVIRTTDPLYLDQGGTTIPLGTPRATAEQALVFHLHGARGQRAQVLNVPAAP
jgi:subtilisin family serine protease